MIQRDPEERFTAEAYLKVYKGVYILSFPDCRTIIAQTVKGQRLYVELLHRRRVNLGTMLMIYPLVLQVIFFFQEMFFPSSSTHFCMTISSNSVSPPSSLQTSAFKSTH